MHRLVLMMVVISGLAACSTTTGPITTSTTLASLPPTPDVVIEVVYSEGLATGTDPVVLVSLGDVVSVSIVSDTPDELHIHGGYDLFFPVPRHEEVSFSFVADHPGIFVVEFESLQEVLFELDVG